jgi:hypothetical protein
MDKTAARGLRFTSVGNASGHHGSVRFNWRLDRDDPAAVTAGFDFLILDGNGRIRADYRFIEAAPAA